MKFENWSVSDEITVADPGGQSGHGSPNPTMAPFVFALNKMLA